MTWRVIHADCVQAMRDLGESSVDAIVTDPPYGLEFMGKEWDSFKTGRSAAYSSGGDLDMETIQSRSGKGGAGPVYVSRPAKRCENCGRQAWSGNPCTCEHPRWVIDNSPLLAFQAWCTAWAAEALRVLKPGAHLLSFGGTRTYHRLACALEDAGFEIRDCLAWLYGSGFPKSLDVSKAIDKAAGAAREVVGHRITGAAMTAKKGNGATDFGSGQNLVADTAPATPDAERWQGWGTALKPAFEPIVLARKPLSGTVSQNVLEYGTGALNVDGTRIGLAEGETPESVYDGPTGPGFSMDGTRTLGAVHVTGHASGRWPANVLLDAEAAEMLDEQSGEASFNPAGEFGQAKRDSGRIYGGGKGLTHEGQGIYGYGDRGGASRFFYTAKTSRSERENGVREYGEVRPVGVANSHPT